MRPQSQTRAYDPAIRGFFTGPAGLARALAVAGLACNALAIVLLVSFDFRSPLRLVLIWVGILLLCAAAWNSPRGRTRR